MGRKFRNKFEERTAEALSGLCEYEPFKLPYVTKRNYIPDFVGTTQDNVEILFEAKGYFRVGDIQKYKAIRDSLKEDQELVFVLHTPTKKVRKGSKLTMAQWCEKENLRWFTVETVRNAFTV